ncbi:MAG: flagellar hook-length control protein FliK [Planctomycetaceae bacterium]
MQTFSAGLAQLLSGQSNQNPISAAGPTAAAAVAVGTQPTESSDFAALVFGPTNAKTIEPADFECVVCHFHERDAQQVLPRVADNGLSLPVAPTEATPESQQENAIAIGSAANDAHSLLDPSPHDAVAVKTPAEASLRKLVPVEQLSVSVENDQHVRKEVTLKELRSSPHDPADGSETGNAESLSVTSYESVASVAASQSASEPTDFASVIRSKIDSPTSGRGESTNSKQASEPLSNQTSVDGVAVQTTRPTEQAPLQAPRSLEPPRQPTAAGLTNHPARTNPNAATSLPASDNSAGLSSLPVRLPRSIDQDTSPTRPASGTGSSPFVSLAEPGTQNPTRPSGSVLAAVEPKSVPGLEFESARSQSATKSVPTHVDSQAFKNPVYEPNQSQPTIASAKQTESPAAPIRNAVPSANPKPQSETVQQEVTSGRAPEAKSSAVQSEPRSTTTASTQVQSVSTETHGTEANLGVEAPSAHEAPAGRTGSKPSTTNVVTEAESAIDHSSDVRPAEFRRPELASQEHRPTPQTTVSQPTAQPTQSSVVTNSPVVVAQAEFTPKPRASNRASTGPTEAASLEHTDEPVSEPTLLQPVAAEDQASVREEATPVEQLETPNEAKARTSSSSHRDTSVVDEAASIDTNEPVEQYEPPESSQSLRSGATLAAVPAATAAVATVAIAEDSEAVVTGVDAVPDVPPTQVPAFADKAETVGSLYSEAAATPDESKQVAFESLVEDTHDTIVSRAKLLQVDETTELEIEIDPPEMGRLNIKVSRTDNEVSARIAVVEPGTLELLQSELSDLRDSLTQSGISVGSFDIEQQSQGQTGFNDRAKPDSQRQQSSSDNGPQENRSNHETSPSNNDDSQSIDIRV